MIKHVMDFNYEQILNARAAFTNHDPEATLSERFDAIKKAWEETLPLYIKHHKENDSLRFDPYFYDWVRVFSPIESMAWNDIRSNGVPLFPQFPACGYFLDFANPIMKIALECDGAAYHDVNKDFKRDTKLIKDGWTIFRVTGKECNLIIDNPFYHESDEPIEDLERRIENYFLNTSDGVIQAMKTILFPKTSKQSKYIDICVETLNRHLSKAHGEYDFYAINYDMRAKHDH